ncbi:ABC transporter [Fusarium longipes]|uniref:ABC transporter n=1 Tax=Fusarium longipes TaxID=694270 RepID=A0A395S7G4_9HYPO|nr:ABC transporter [Fusarium longipes]
MADYPARQSESSGRTVVPEPQPTKKKSNFTNYLRVFGYATKWDICVYVVGALASIGVGVTMPLMNVVLGQLVGDFSETVQNPYNMDLGSFKAMLQKQSLYIVGLFLGRWLLNSINKFCFRMIGIRLSSAIRHHYLRSLFAQSIHVIDSMPPGAPATAITATSNTLQIGVSERLGTFVTYLSTIIAAIAVAFTWSWNLTLVSASLLLYIAIIVAVVVPIYLKANAATLEADAQATGIASEALEGVRLVNACGAHERVISRYSKWVDTAMKRSQRVAPIIGAQTGLVFFGIFGVFGLAFWYGTQRFIDGAINNVGVVIIVLTSVMLILFAFSYLEQPILAISQAMVAATELFTVIDTPLPPTGSLTPDINSKDLVFEGVTFEYPSRPGARVLDNLSFRIQAGQNTALVGPSGSGKSTIVGLLERWYSLKHSHTHPKAATASSSKQAKRDSHCETKQEQSTFEVPTMSPITPIGGLSGCIRVGAHDLDDLDSKWWRGQIGLVQQEPFLFNSSIFENVANGLLGTEWENEPEANKREMVQDACQEAYAHEFICRLPDGYDTRVGDGGAKLSGGQKQRLAIARSIVKKPQIMILDEATSAIDAKSEKIVQAALDRATKTRTTITIAHRLSTIQKADHIVVLSKGRAVEEGTHKSLMEQENGVYYSLVQAQSIRLSITDDIDSDVPATTYVEELKSTAVDVEQMAEVFNGDNNSPGTKPGMSRTLKQSFMKLLYGLRAQWPSFLLIAIASMGVGAATPIQAWLFAKAVIVFISPTDELKEEGDFWGAMWLVLAGGVGIAYFFQTWTSLRLQYYVGATTRQSYLRDMLHQELSFFDDDSRSSGTLIGRIAGDPKQVEEVFGMNLASATSSVFTIVGCLIISLTFGWKLGLVGLCVTVPIMMVSGFWKFRHELQFDRMNAAVFAESSQFASEAIGAMRTVSSLTMESAINNRYKQLLGGHVEAARKKAQWTAVIFGFAESATLGCQALILWYGGRLISSGEYSLEAFMVSYMAIINGVEYAGQILGVAPSAAQAAAAANRILDVKESNKSSQEAAKSGPAMEDAEGGVEIELRNVSFKYPTRNVSVYNDLSLTIEKGQYAALVGPSGCGKTTIISLLERFYDLEPDHGEILWNRKNIKDFGVYQYRQHLSLVSQEPNLFRGSIRDNILFGVADPSSISEERIHEVCRDVFIHDVIVSLPDGYNTEVGQKGVSLSGGQKQRIAIARALIRDPKLLLLDEATSALDSESEKIVQAAFEKARKGRTMVAVAHRLATIQDADVIFVFDQGMVVEKGTHSELLQKRGIYWDMVK